MRLEKTEQHKKAAYPEESRRFGIRLLFYAGIFAIGAAGYTLVELTWRGHTHWTMSIMGGLCFLMIYALFTRLGERRLWLKCLLGMLAITAAELIAGAFLNLHLGWKVWDYSRYRLHFLGQISLLYSLIWFFMCIPLNFLCRFLNSRFNAKRSTKRRRLSLRRRAGEGI